MRMENGKLNGTNTINRKTQLTEKWHNGSLADINLDRDAILATEHHNWSFGYFC